MTEIVSPATAYFDSDPTGEIRPGAATASGIVAGRTRAWTRLLAPSSLVPTYVGVLLTVVGFGLIALAWAEIARYTNVGLQMPYLVSAGFTGLALVMVGLVMVNVAAKRQDGAERNRQMQVLAETMAELQRTLERLDDDGSERG